MTYAEIAEKLGITRQGAEFIGELALTKFTARICRVMGRDLDLLARMGIAS